MDVPISIVKKCYHSQTFSSTSIVKFHQKPSPQQQINSKNQHQSFLYFNRRLILLSGGVSFVAISTLNHAFRPLIVNAEEVESGKKEEDGGVLDTIKSLFDPNEKTKSGKVLPKAYLKSAREVVKTLRESLKEDAKDVSKFRRAADSAKESIREYLNDWKGQQTVLAEESYVSIEKVIRSLANFYSKAGPFAALPEKVKSSILDDLSTAEAFL
ncbi:photosystem II 11 kDa protein-like protein [Tasmannia lanceolata]|uniref:photosystem II 11 kDa protein-like protein n=1 Tax=Tasmannia lanceolata TaxID=3420 RepID=UPI004063D859